jgi:hypothetical protein
LDVSLAAGADGAGKIDPTQRGAVEKYAGGNQSDDDNSDGYLFTVRGYSAPLFSLSSSAFLRAPLRLSAFLCTFN